MKKLITLALLLGFMAMPKADDSYVVNTAIYYQNALIADPVLMVLPGQEAAIEASYTEEDAYRLALTVTPLANKKIDIAAHLKLAGEELSFSIVLKPGQLGQIRTGPRGLGLMVEKPDNGSPTGQK